MADFGQTIATAYAVDGASLDLGRGVHDGAVVPAATVKLPLRMVNRHGLIAGATGQARHTPTESHKKAAGAAAGGVAAVTAFLPSKEGKQLEKQVMRGVFGLLKKKL